MDEIQSVWIGYKTDFQHSYASRDMICVCSNQATMIEHIMIHALKTGAPINDEQLWNLENISQTQGYPECEYDTEEITLNELI